jgi:hypothetical protein
VPSETLAAWKLSAYKLGIAEAERAARLTVSPSLHVEAAQELLDLILDGDPAVWDCLPREPDLSGEYAEDLTPNRLFALVTDVRPTEHVGELVETLADAYVEGVAQTFGVAVENVLAQFVQQHAMAE